MSRSDWALAAVLTLLACLALSQATWHRTWRPDIDRVPIKVGGRWAIVK